ncbi:MAG: hypothetical protein LBI69_01420 [Puniceicoccales bacterium]|jgi:hypothetical protein|nr:hypothetical protein [Puniceicoccales bacterium]
MEKIPADKSKKDSISRDNLSKSNESNPTSENLINGKKEDVDPQQQSTNGTETSDKNATVSKLSGGNLGIVALSIVVGAAAGGAVLLVLAFAAKIALAGWLIGLVISGGAAIGLAAGAAIIIFGDHSEETKGTKQNITNLPDEIIDNPKEINVAERNIANLTNALRALDAAITLFDADEASPSDENVIAKIKAQFELLSSEVQKFGNDNPLFDGFPALELDDLGIFSNKKHLIEVRNALGLLLEMHKKDQPIENEITKQSISFYRAFTNLAFHGNRILHSYDLYVKLMAQESEPNQSISPAKLIPAFNGYREFNTVIDIIVTIPAIEDDSVREAAEDLICLLGPNAIGIVSEMAADYDKANRSACESPFDEETWRENYKTSSLFAKPLIDPFIASINLRKNRERIVSFADVANEGVQKEAKKLKKQIDDTLANMRKNVIIKNDGETKNLLSNFHGEVKTLMEKEYAVEAKKRTPAVKELYRKWKEAETAYKAAKCRKSNQSLLDDMEEKSTACQTVSTPENDEAFLNACAALEARVKTESQAMNNAQNTYEDAFKCESDAFKKEAKRYSKYEKSVFAILEQNFKQRKTEVLKVNKMLIDFLKEHSDSANP